MRFTDLNDLIGFDENHVSDKVLKILLAEDCENNVLLVQLYLKKLPYSIDVAENGAKAFEKYKANSYDLILMDIEMPFTDGYQATTDIRKYEHDNNLKSTPIVAVTAHALSENKEKAYSVGCDYFMTKPVRKADLISVIKKFTE
ncbi:response regulator [Desulfovibrio gilichinskyi]|uniref:CheY chemotaxis protein or a CheY-like REC (Receiver) domain n=1 Tax=Desulfovibrio gilichinskyi TaxID=1519643 RepID=A0A1X7EUC6_9BACT|nr:response regulator [Desulfovibrio gilichinskyi]SMF40081.1 CheY chemotaxis protein or a CheY-like REC (receiver) domain [Desulfovibrio gilichinskyi]